MTKQLLLEPRVYVSCYIKTTSEATKYMVWYYTFYSLLYKIVTFVTIFATYLNLRLLFIHETTYFYKYFYQMVREKDYIRFQVVWWAGIKLHYHLNIKKLWENCSSSFGKLYVVLLCFNEKVSVFQLAFAGLLSILYSLLMMLVLVSLIKQAVENSFCSITTIFICFVAGVFIIAAFLHPQVSTFSLLIDEFCSSKFVNFTYANS